MWSTRLEQPLNSYSAQELEHWVLVRRSADISWKWKNMKFSRNRRKNNLLTSRLPWLCRQLFITVSSTILAVEYDLSSSASSSPLNNHFWRVTLTGHSTEAQLTADHLRSIQAHDTGLIRRGVAMRRNILKFSIGKGQHRQHIVRPLYFRA